MVIGGIASNRAEQKMQQKQYQQETQAQINKAEADAAAAQQQVQQMQMDQKYHQQQQQQQQPPTSVYAHPQQQQQYQQPYQASSSLPPPPAALSPVFVLFSPHIVDEESLALKQYGIISVPKGANVRLVNGTPEHGMDPPYQDYVLVDYNGKVGKVSRHVLRVAEA
jgi:hypothetical protein